MDHASQEHGVDDLGMAQINAGRDEMLHIEGGVVDPKLRAPHRQQRRIGDGYYVGVNDHHPIRASWAVSARNLNEANA